MKSYEVDGPKGSYYAIDVQLARPLGEEDRGTYEKAEAMYEVVSTGAAQMHSADIADSDSDGAVPFDDADIDGAKAPFFVYAK